ncbi:cell wall-binding repeat-containing protein [Clostridium rectalis]|uniref:cell wall-binding repeat-containing protein n=1 Tax=Clostridium rectalis TaxID=2040295 RepID=UPI000F632350|nr:cell wall-binding repeat-containing protein [Clostridium rectalis]
MSKRSHKALASATVMSLILTSTLSAVNVSAAATVERTGGSDRIATSQEVAKQVFGKAETVVLVNGYGYADAVSATPLAKQLNAPILLTNEAEKPSADLTATLASLGAKKVVIVGGTGVVKTALETELAKSYEVERIAGTSRYETNANVAKKVVELTKSTKGVLVSAAGYADALSVASIAASKGMPVLFGNANEVPAEVKEAAKGLELVAVGGTAVLPDTVLESVKATRIASGADRFETNLKVLEYFEGDLKDVKNIFMAAGGASGDANFADALVASAAAAKYGAPVVLTGFGANKTNVDASIKYVKDHMKDDSKVTIVGGTGVVSEDIEKELKGEKAEGKNEVASVEAVNLNQIKVKFATAVDGDTAEDVRNYELDGEELSSDKAVAELQGNDDELLITINAKEGQGKEKTLKVKEGILVSDKSKLIKEDEKKVTFKDTVAPTVKDVAVNGNKKVIIEFSEAVFTEGTTEEAALETIADQVEINNRTIKSIGYNTDKNGDNELAYSKLKNSVEAKGYNKKGYFVNKVEFYLDSEIESGTNTLKVPEGKDGEYLVDAAGWTMKEYKVDFKVDKVTGAPKVKSVKGSTDGKIYINFDRALDQKSVDECKITLNDGSNLDVTRDLEEDDTQIKLSGVENIRTGSNTVEISNKLKDAYGNKIDDDIRATFTADKDTAKPKVNYILTVDDNTIRVIYSKDVSKKVAEDKDNYTLRDSKSNKVKLEEVKSISDDTYDITLSDEKKLDSSKYTLKVENIVDLAGNIMDDYEGNINGAEIVPTVKDAVKIKDAKDHKLAVIFDQEMKSSSVTKVENYKYKSKDNKIKQLPSDTKITVSSDNKTVTIELPDSHFVLESTEKDNISDSNIVKEIIVTKDVESSSGVKMDADSTKTISEKSVGALVSLAEDPMTIKDDGDEAIVQIKFDGTVDEIDDTKIEENGKKVYSAYAVADGAPDANDKNIYPDNVSTKGDIVEFRFKDEEAVKVKAIGSDLKVSKIDGLKDIIGNSISVDMSKLEQVNTNDIKPELSYEKKDGYVNINLTESDSNNFEAEEIAKTWNVDLEEGKITVKFNTRLEENCANKDDFKFVSTKASNLEVKNAKVEGNTVVYTLKDESVAKLIDQEQTQEITVKVNDTQSIKSKEDKDGETNKYEPSSIEKGEGLKFKVSKEMTGKAVAPARAVQELINKLPKLEEISLENKEQVENANTAYNNLKDNKKPVIEKSLVEKLTKALEKINELSDEATKAENQKLVDGKIGVVEDKYELPAGTSNITDKVTEKVKAAVKEESITVIVEEEKDGKYKVTLTKGKATANKAGIIVTVATE